MSVRNLKSSRVAFAGVLPMAVSCAMSWRLMM